MSTEENNLLYFNGIDGLAGDYLLPPMSQEQFAQIVLDRKQLADKDAGEYHETYLATGHLGLADDRDAGELAEAGWGIIFAENEDPAVIEALRPLMERRQKMAGDLYYEYLGTKTVDERHRPGYRINETKEGFLEDRGSESFGPADPENAPYYMLIAGDPARIPFEFQYQLDLQYAVGRVHFRTPAEYAQYAANVVAAETSKAKLPRRALFFGPDHDGSTALSARYLVEPLLENLPRRLKLQWEMEAVLREKATKEKLANTLNSAEAPALLFTASHGAGFPPDHPVQLDRQGALYCQDIKYQTARGVAIEDCYLWAGDLATETNLLGRLTFHFACFSAGTPQRNSFRLSPELSDPMQMSDQRRKIANLDQLAKESFVARLPQKLLLNGVLATVGHVDRAWGTSIYYKKGEAAKAFKHLAGFRSTMKRLMEGMPVGYAMDLFDERYGEMSAAITQEQTYRDYGAGKKSNAEMVRLWTANQDARNYVIIGDPAVRLSLAGTEPTTGD